MRVHLTYYHLGGKFADESSYLTEHKLLHRIWAEVRDMTNARELPGLVRNHSPMLVSVDVPQHPHNHPILIMPDPIRDKLKRLESLPRQTLVRVRNKDAKDDLVAVDEAFDLAAELEGDV